MHEVGLAGGVLRVVEETRKRDPFERVTHLTLEVGALSSVEVSSLRFALQAIVSGTCLAEARIEILEPPATAWCLSCGRSVLISSRLDLCPQCGTAHLEPTGGMELRVLDLRVI
jgi:hydrogenase nickel incorporation protein HypA/HybF